MQCMGRPTESSSKITTGNSKGTPKIVKGTPLQSACLKNVFYLQNTFFFQKKKTPYSNPQPWPSPVLPLIPFPRAHPTAQSPFHDRSAKFLDMMVRMLNKGTELGGVKESQLVSVVYLTRVEERDECSTHEGKGDE